MIGLNSLRATETFVVFLNQLFLATFQKQAPIPSDAVQFNYGTLCQNSEFFMLKNYLLFCKNYNNF